MGLTRVCFGNAPLQVCFSLRKRKDVVSYCTGNQEGCQPLSGGTYYTNCAGFNVGCNLYKLVSGTYEPVQDGFYSNGTITLYSKDGVTQNPTFTCSRFFRLDWIKDCLNKDNLSGTYYVTVVDDNTWVPDTNKVYRIPVPLSVNSNCQDVLYQSYYAIRFLNTTPTYNIGNANYLETNLTEMSTTYALPGFLQNRCTTRQLN